jgi:hypothetical protein
MCRFTQKAADLSYYRWLRQRFWAMRRGADATAAKLACAEIGG